MDKTLKTVDNFIKLSHCKAVEPLRKYESKKSYPHTLKIVRKEKKKCG